MRQLAEKCYFSSVNGIIKNAGQNPSVAINVAVLTV
jgi:hypothetical protein